MVSAGPRSWKFDPWGVGFLLGCILQPQNASRLADWSDPAPWMHQFCFWMNSSSSQLLDLVQTLRLGHFYFPSLASRQPIKKPIQLSKHFKPYLPDIASTYLHPAKNPKTPFCWNHQYNCSTSRTSSTYMGLNKTMLVKVWIKKPVVVPMRV